MALDPYDQLGLKRGATAAEIRAAYKRRTQQMHPDKHPGDPFAETRYSLIRESYEILSDPARRSAYDSEGKTERDDLPERAAAFVEHVAIGMLETAEQCGEIGRIDLPKSIRFVIGRTQGTARSDLMLAKRAIPGIEKQLKRTRRKGKGNNVFADLIAVRLDKAHKRVRDIEITLGECEAALALLEDYEDVDPERRPSLLGSVTFSA